MLNPIGSDWLRIALLVVIACPAAARSAASHVHHERLHEDQRVAVRLHESGKLAVVRGKGWHQHGLDPGISAAAASAPTHLPKPNAEQPLQDVHGENGAGVHNALSRAVMMPGQALQLTNAILAVGAFLVIYGLRVRPRKYSSASAQSCVTQEEPWCRFWGIETQFQMAIFIAYVAFSCTHLFLQHRAGSSGYSAISATVLIYAAKFLVALMMHAVRGDGNFSALFQPAGGPIFGRIPTCILTLIPGACLGGYDAISFFSLAALDPVTYQIMLHVRLVFIALLWQATFRRQLSAPQWFALILFSMASATKGLDQVKEIGTVATSHGLAFAFTQILLAVIGNVLAEFLLKEVPVATDLLNSCLYFQGLVVLLTVAWARQGHAALWDTLLGPPAWKALWADPWMLGSILCLTAFGIVTAYFLRELSNLLKELSACFVIVSSAAVEWGVLGASPCTLLGAQAVVLAILAVGVYNAEPLRIGEARGNRSVLRARILRKS